ncbi:MAG: hypothetical protein JWQ25_1884 [Daejeonella sp.]|nr:hypothetical protein [Daejeonella sp.]
MEISTSQSGLKKKRLQRSDKLAKAVNLSSTQMYDQNSESCLLNFLRSMLGFALGIAVKILFSHLEAQRKE